MSDQAAQDSQGHLQSRIIRGFSRAQPRTDQQHASDSTTQPITTAHEPVNNGGPITQSAVARTQQQQNAQPRFGRHDAREALHEAIVQRGLAPGLAIERYGPSHHLANNDYQVAPSVDNNSSEVLGRSTGGSRDAPGEIDSQIDRAEQLRAAEQPQGTGSSQLPSTRSTTSPPSRAEDSIQLNRQRSALRSAETSRPPQSNRSAAHTAHQPVSTERIRRAMQRRDWDRLRGNHNSAAEATLESESRQMQRQRRDGQ